MIPDRMLRRPLLPAHRLAPTSGQATATVPATFLRVGTAKAVFLDARDLPRERRAREALLLQVLGGPDPGGRQAEGIGGVGAEGGAVVIVGPPGGTDREVDYRIGVLGPADSTIDWARDQDSLCAGVGPFAFWQGMLPPCEGPCRVRLLQPDRDRRLEVFFPVTGGQVAEHGAFLEDGAPFPSTEVRLELLDPGAHAARAAALLPTGRDRDSIVIPEVGEVQVSLIDAGVPTVFVRADALGLTGRERATGGPRERKLLERLHAVRAAAALLPGAVRAFSEAPAGDGAAPDVAWIAKPTAYRTLSGIDVAAGRSDLLARILTGGRLHPTFTDAGSIALAAAAALPGTVVSEVSRTLPGVATRIGHPGGTLAVGAQLAQRDGVWHLERATVSRGVRRLMSGVVHLPPARPCAAA